MYIFIFISTTALGQHKSHNRYLNEALLLNSIDRIIIYLPLLIWTISIA